MQKTRVKGSPSDPRTGHPAVWREAESGTAVKDPSPVSRDSRIERHRLPYKGLSLSIDEERLTDMTNSGKSIRIVALILFSLLVIEGCCGGNGPGVSGTHPLHPGPT